MQETTTTAVAPRLPDGKFAKGNRIGPGNPYMGQLQSLKRAMLSCATPAKMTKLMNDLFELCADPDPKVKLAAMDLLLNRVFGKPKEIVELDVQTNSALDIARYSDQQLAQVLSILEQPQQPAQPDQVIEIEQVLP